MSYQNIIVDNHDGIGIITLNRPEVLNALNRDLAKEQYEAFQEMENNPQIKAVIFTGKGDRAFSAGADIHEISKLAQNPNPELYNSNWLSIWDIASSKKPVIGAINGLAYGGGAAMASGFDIRVGCERTSFKFLAASYGRINSTWSLPMQIGWPMAKELLFTARLVKSKEAYNIGLLNHLVPSDQLMPKAIEIAQQISANDPRMVQGIKELMIQNVGVIWEKMYRNEKNALEGKLRPTAPTDAFKDFLDRKGRK